MAEFRENILQLARRRCGITLKLRRFAIGEALRVTFCTFSAPGPQRYHVPGRQVLRALLGTSWTTLGALLKSPRRPMGAS